ncbi:ligase-associated DNA damage response endonuclease PdeM [Arenimonas composti]|uniref:Calcineurin-like phosphoesterase domain-containing protein n=1 Tax=Arenimonas composti TR7-09 = DSM 18010 TaxID=1121013 RepID=A0A091BDA0_9GAMM|nr:ligase-associated DNA damage response endonuclease PdeM [Arenimonas composti]KFN50658.1 hypothetical protein P873_05720 [Arenimonas composti TR7-09 = DSM 18010]
MRVEVAGEELQLLGERALFWPARRRLLLADLHLGKADAFRRAGIGLPSGGTAADLARIGGLLDSTGARSLWVLGDLLHGDPSPRRWRAAWDHFRAARPALELVVVAGNHDRALADAGLDVTILDEAADGPFVLRHEPARQPGATVICGHLHPVLLLPGLPRRWPAFVLEPGLLQLPAFSLFTGGVPVPAATGRRRYACVEGSVVAVDVAADRLS